MLLMFPFDPTYGLSQERIVGPGVLGVATSELLSNLEIGALPEALEILSELHGLEARREELHQDGTLAVVDARGVGEAETLLEANAKDGELGALTVFDADATAGGYLDMGGSEAVDLLLLIVAQLSPEGCAEVDLPEFRGGGGLTYI